MLFLLCSALALAAFTQIKTFSDGSTFKNVTLNASENKTYHISLPKSYSYTSGSIYYKVPASAVAIGCGTETQDSCVNVSVSDDKLLRWYRMTEFNKSVVRDFARGVHAQDIVSDDQKINLTDPYGQKGARYFDGNVYLDPWPYNVPADYDEELNVVNASYIVWLQMDDWNNNQYVFNGDEAGQSNSNAINIRDGNITLYWDADRYRSGALGLQQAVWYMIAFTVNDTNVSLYIDGELNKTWGLENYYGSGIGAQYILIGAEDSGLNHVTGNMSDFSIWNKTLTASEIQSLYQGNSVIEGTIHYGQKTPQSTYDIIRTAEQMIEFNITKLNNEISLCNCSECTVDFKNCLYPITIEPTVGGSLELFNLSINYYGSVSIIDERNRSLFDINNVSSALIYLDDNESYIDLQALNTAVVNISTDNSTTGKLRVEFTYADGGVVSRYIDLSITELNTRVCANMEEVTHYEQVMVSAQQRPAILRNIYADCYVAADYTRFAYSTAYSLKAYTIPASYELITETNGQETILAGVDGSTQTIIDIDQIEFTQRGYALDILQSVFNIRKSDDTTAEIYYRNYNSDNTDLQLEIKRDNGATVYLKNDFSNPNEFTVFYSWATMNVSNSTVFTATVTETNPSGSNSITRFFNTRGSTGALLAQIAFTVALLLTIFGLTITIPRITFSWFGILMVGGAIGILAFSIQTFYVTFLMWTDIIILIYIVVTMVQKNASLVT